METAEAQWLKAPIGERERQGTLAGRGPVKRHEATPRGRFFFGRAGTVGLPFHRCPLSCQGCPVLDRAGVGKSPEDFSGANPYGYADDGKLTGAN
jgi:hypothetical protein